MLGMIPLPYKLLAGAALLVGVFTFGYMKGSAAADTKIAEFTTKQSTQANNLEKKNTKINNDIVIKFVDRVNTIKEKEYVYRDVIEDSVPTQHVMSNGWVYTHDISATSGNADPARASNATPSGIADTTALLGIVKNYTSCQTNAEQLKKLQQWVNENKAAVDKIAEEKK